MRCHERSSRGVLRTALLKAPNDLHKKGDRMNLTLWIATALLAMVALIGGITKTFVPQEKLAEHHGGE